MNNNYLMALAMNSNVGTLHLDNADIPVKIVEVESETGKACSPMTTFKCLVVNDDQIRYHPRVQSKLEDCVKYTEMDVRNTMAAYGMIREGTRFAIDRVIFNEPATIVYWKDGTKTVVKCQPGDVYSKETGLALCFAKKALGNKGNFNDVFHKWIPEEDAVAVPSKEEAGVVLNINLDLPSAAEAACNLKEALSKILGGDRRG